MIDLLNFKTLKKAHENFVNHVFSRIANKIIKTYQHDISNSLIPLEKAKLIYLKLDLKSFVGSNKIDNSIFRKYKGVHKINLSKFALNERIELYQFLQNNLYNIVSMEPISFDGIMTNFNNLDIGKILEYQEQYKKDYTILSAKFGKEKTIYLNNIKKTYDFDKLKNLYELFDKIFSYKDVSNGYIKKQGKLSTTLYSLYNLAEDIGVRTCVYCNRNYIYSIKDKDSQSEKLIVPHFDHWLPQSKYPLFTTSFYNLIPSCFYCNSSVKNKNEMNLNRFLHPYSDPDIVSKYRFTYKKVKGEYVISIVAKRQSDEKRTRNTITFFKLNQIYSSHTIELIDLITLKENYGENI